MSWTKAKKFCEFEWKLQLKFIYFFFIIYFLNFTAFKNMFVPFKCHLKAYMDSAWDKSGPNSFWIAPRSCFLCRLNMCRTWQIFVLNWACTLFFLLFLAKQNLLAQSQLYLIKSLTVSAWLMQKFASLAHEFLPKIHILCITIIL